MLTLTGTIMGKYMKQASAPARLHPRRSAGRPGRHGDDGGHGLARHRRPHQEPRDRAGAPGPDRPAADRAGAVGGRPARAAGQPQHRAAHRLRRRQPRADAPGATGLQVVVWSLREGSLWRWESPSVRTVQDLEEPTPARPAAAGPGQPGAACLRRRGRLAVLLLLGQCLEQLPVHRRHRQAATPARSTPTSHTPAGLRIAMQFAEGSGLTGTLTRELEVTVR